MSLRYAVLAALGIGFAFAGCAQQTDGPAAGALRACLAAADLSDAAVIGHCGNALRATDLSKEDRAKALTLRGSAYALQDDCVRAVEDLSEAIALAPDLAPPYVARGRCYWQQDELEMALSNFHRAVTRNPNYADAYGARGDLFLQLNETDRALEDFANVIRLAPEAAGGYEGRGNAQAQKGDYDAALASLDKAVLLAPEDAWVYTNRALVQLLRGKWRAALNDSDKAIALKPEDPVLFENRAVVLFVTGEYRRAIDDMEAAARLSPGNPYPYLWNYMSTWRLGESPDAALRTAKSETEAWPAVALRHYQGRAIEPDVVAETMAARPEVVVQRKCEADIFLAMHARAEGRREDARQKLEHARDNCPRDRFERAVAIAELGRL